MAKSEWLGKAGALYIVTKIKGLLNQKVDKVDGKGLSTNDFTAAYKTKLDGIAAGANATTVDSALNDSSTNPVQNKVVNAALANKVDKVNGKGLSTNDYTTTEKNKLAGIAAGANATTVDSALSTSSTNPVQNKVVNSALINKVDKVNGKGLSTNDFTAAYKTKLDGIAAGANATTVDSALNASSTNPIQNKVVNAALANKASLVSPTFTGTPKAPTQSAGDNSTNIATTAFVSSAVSTAIGNVKTITHKIITEFPSTGESNVIYLKANGASGTNVYDEYIYIAETKSFEKIGSTDVDLSGYMKTSDISEITDAEIDAMFAAE